MITFCMAHTLYFASYCCFLSIVSLGHDNDNGAYYHGLSLRGKRFRDQRTKRNMLKGPRIVCSEGAASLAVGLAGNSALWSSLAFDNFGGGLSSRNMVLNPSPMMPLSASAAMYDLPQGGILPFEELNLASWSSLALNPSTKRAHADALLRVSLAVQPPSDANALSPEKRSHAEPC